MSIFYKLEPPRLDSVTNQWYVRIKDMAPLLYLVNGPTNVKILASFLDYGWNHFAFNSELEAMHAAHTYYNEHNEVYPYVMTITLGSVSSNNESQVMEFG